jgi:ribosomal protein S18 acetylase RimI-like enzyme
MTLLIRQAKDEDVNSIVALYARATKLMHQISPNGFGEALKSPLDIEQERESFTRALDDQGTVVLVAEQGGKVVGFIMGVVEKHPDDLLSAPYVTVQYLYVSEKFRRAGIAKTLIQAVENWAADKGLYTLELKVWNNNESAKDLFQSLGYLFLELRMAKRIGDKVK